MNRVESRYRGRFAPSPTGPLHFGSLVAAVGSYLDAKSRGGEWLVRMEDLDKPREAPGAADAILRCLERMGLEWDGAVMYQSARTEAYREALDRLVRAGAAFGCSCSRREAGDVYPGTCRPGSRGAARGEARSWRFRVGDEPVAFMDRVQGRFEQRLETEVGDFVLLRADGIFAYQLAVVVDDAEQGITDVVRGADLLDSTPRQIALQRALGVAAPEYLHLPVVLGADGQKLSKQTLAPAVEESGAAVWRALEFLGQELEGEMRGAGPAELLAWGVGAWDVSKIPAVVMADGSLSTQFAARGR